MRIRKFIEKEELEKIVDECAEILKGRSEKDTVFLIVMNGAFMFASDVLKKINWRGKIFFIKMSSYVGKQRGTAQIELSNISKETDIRGKNVIIIEDIIDSGKSMEFLCNEAREFLPKSIEIMTLLLRQGAQKPLQADVLNYGILVEPDKFIVGYGLDYNDAYRGLNNLAVLEEEDKNGIR